MFNSQNIVMAILDSLKKGESIYIRVNTKQADQGNHYQSMLGTFKVVGHFHDWHERSRCCLLKDKTCKIFGVIT